MAGTGPDGDSRAAALAATLSRAKVWFICAAGLLLLLGGVHWVYNRWTHVHLDDARVDGAVVTISSRVAGWVTELPVIEGDVVKKAQLLVRIDARDSVLQREALAAKLKAIENQATVVQSQTCQVDQETLGRYESETNRLAAAEAET